MKTLSTDHAGVDHAATALMVDPDQAPPLAVLSAEEAAELRQCEEDIDRGLAGMVGMARALARIRERKLYRAYGTFENYCLERWKVSAHRARQNCRAFGVLKNLGLDDEGNNCSGFVLPANESQLRPLAALPAEQQANAWSEVLRTAPGGKITAKHVQKVVDARLGRQAPGAPIADGQSQTAKAIEPPAAGQTQEDALKAQAENVILEMRNLLDAAGSADSAAAANLPNALQIVQEFRDHVERVKFLQKQRPSPRPGEALKNPPQRERV